MSKELFPLRVCQLYNALCFGYTQGGAGVSKKRLRLSYLELQRNSDVALLNTENLRVRALAPHIYYSTEGNNVFSINNPYIGQQGRGWLGGGKRG
jgi:hypothetical protein